MVPGLGGRETRMLQPGPARPLPLATLPTRLPTSRPAPGPKSTSPGPRDPAGHDGAHVAQHGIWTRSPSPDSASLDRDAMDLSSSRVSSEQSLVSCVERRHRHHANPGPMYNTLQHDGSLATRLKLGASTSCEAPSALLGLKALDAEARCREAAHGPVLPEDRFSMLSSLEKQAVSCSWGTRSGVLAVQRYDCLNHRRHIRTLKERVALGRDIMALSRLANFAPSRIHRTPKMVVVSLPRCGHQPKLQGSIADGIYFVALLTGLHR